MVEVIGYRENLDYVHEMLEPIEANILFVNHHSRKIDYPDIKKYDIVIHSWLKTSTEMEIREILSKYPICKDQIYVVQNTEIIYQLEDIPLIGKRGKQLFIFFDFTHRLDEKYPFYFASSILYEVLSKNFFKDEDVVVKTAKSFVVSKINSLERKYKELNDEMHELLEEIQKKSAEIKLINEKISSLKNKDFSKDARNIEAIRNIPEIARIVPALKYIIIYTNEIISYPIEGKRYRFGKFKIIIDLVSHDIRIYNLSFQVDAYWHPSQHPHIDGEGKPCWGTLAETIMVLLNEREYSSLISVIIDFLKSVNTEDMAGRFYKEWPVYEEQVEKGEKV